MVRTPPSNTFGAQLRLLRKRARLNQRDLGLATGYSESQICRFEQRARPPELSTLMAVFVPALYLNDAPDEVALLLSLAAAQRGESPPELAAEVHPLPPPGPARESDADAHLAAAEWAEIAQGDLIEAAEHYARAGDLRAAVETLHDRGQRLLNAGQGERAASVIDGLLSTLSAQRRTASAVGLRARLLSTRGDVLASTTRAAEAEANYREALTLTRGAAHAMLAHRLGGLLVSRGQSREALTLVRRELDDVPPKHVFIRANLKIVEAGALMGLSRFEESEGASNEALALAGQIAQAAPDLVASIVARGHNSLGGINAMRHNQVQALQHWQDASAAARQANLKQIEYRCMGNIGNVMFEQGDLDGAALACEHALAGLREIGDWSAASKFVHLSALVHYVRGDLERAVSAARESLALREKLGDRNGRVNALNQLAMILLADGDAPAASAIAQESVDEARSLGEERVLGYGLCALCQCRLSLEDGAAALQAISEAAALHNAITHDLTLAGTIATHRALALLATGDPWGAERAISDGPPPAGMENRIEREITLARVQRALGAPALEAAHAARARQLIDSSGYRVFLRQIAARN